MDPIILNSKRGILNHCNKSILKRNFSNNCERSRLLMKPTALTKLGFAILSAFSLLVHSILAQTILWQDNFDDANANDRWDADNGVWQIGSPTIGPQTNSNGYATHSGPDCATTGLTADYPAGMNSRLVRFNHSSFQPPTNTRACVSGIGIALAPQPITIMVLWRSGSEPTPGR